jgi:Glycine zipper 2TM domain
MKGNAMLARNTIRALAAAALIAGSMPALADHDRWDRRDAERHTERHTHSRAADYRYPPAREVVVERHVERRVVRRPVYDERPVYRARPAPVYHPPAYEPAPVYYPRNHERDRGLNVLGTAAGAIVGAAIGSQIGHGPNRAATTAVGAVIGGAVGSQF